MRKILWMVILGIGFACFGASFAKQQDKTKPTTFVGTSQLSAACIIRLGNGPKFAEINFCGEKVKYSGDLPIDESVKVFFDAVLHYDQARCDERKEKTQSRAGGAAPGAGE